MHRVRASALNFSVKNYLFVVIRRRSFSHRNSSWLCRSGIPALSVSQQGKYISLSFTAMVSNNGMELIRLKEIGCENDRILSYTMVDMDSRKKVCKLCDAKKIDHIRHVA